MMPIGGPFDTYAGNILGFPHGRVGDVMYDVDGTVLAGEEPVHVNPLPREIILDEAKKLICVDRHEQYGSAKKNLGMTAILWSAWTGNEIQAHDVAMLNALQKISRELCGKPNKDNPRDAISYLALYAELLGESIS